MNKVRSTSQAEDYLSRAREVLKACFENAVVVILNVMLGFPGDLEDDLRTTLEFVEETVQTHNRIAARTGAARAKEIVFGARLYPAETFERYNIINRVLPDGDLTEKAMNHMRRLAEDGPTVAIAAAKRIINTL